MTPKYSSEYLQKNKLDEDGASLLNQRKMQTPTNGRAMYGLNFSVNSRAKYNIHVAKMAPTTAAKYII